MQDMTVTLAVEYPVFFEDIPSFKARMIAKRVANFDPSDVPERIRRAEHYSEKCRRLRKERRERIAEFLTYAFFIATVLSSCVNLLMGD